MTMLFIKKPPPRPLVKRVLTRLGLPTQPDEWRAFWSGFADGGLWAYAVLALFIAILLVIL